MSFKLFYSLFLLFVCFLVYTSIAVDHFWVFSGIIKDLILFYFLVSFFSFLPILMSCWRHLCHLVLYVFFLILHIRSRFLSFCSVLKWRTPKVSEGKKVSLFVFFVIPSHTFIFILMYRKCPRNIDRKRKNSFKSRKTIRFLDRKENLIKGFYYLYPEKTQLPFWGLKSLKQIK